MQRSSKDQADENNPAIRFSVPIDLHAYFLAEKPKDKHELEKAKDNLTGIISNALTEKLESLVKDPELLQGALLSSAFFAVNTNFLLSEFIKNSEDAAAKQLEFYVHVDKQGVTAMLVDTGKGMPRCDLSLMSLASDPGVNTTSTKLALYFDGGEQNPFKYTVKNNKSGVVEEFTIKSGTGPDQLSPAHYAVLTAMFKEASLLGKDLNLDNDTLNSAQREAYNALLEITTNRDHTTKLNISKKSVGLVDYHTIVAGGREGKLTSDKRDEVGAKGGRGMGIASGESILHLLGGKTEIGNVSNVSQELQEKMGVDLSQHVNGAALVFSSPLYSPASLSVFMQTDAYINGDNPKRYTDYVQRVSGFDSTIMDIIRENQPKYETEEEEDFEFGMLGAGLAMMKMKMKMKEANDATNASENDGETKFSLVVDEETSEIPILEDASEIPILEESEIPILPVGLKVNVSSPLSQVSEVDSLGSSLSSDAKSLVSPSIATTEDESTPTSTMSASSNDSQSPSPNKASAFAGNRFALFKTLVVQAKPVEQAPKANNTRPGMSPGKGDDE